MVFSEPKVEFVPIDLSISTTGSTCGEVSSQGGDRCIGDGPHTKCIGCEDVAQMIA